MARSSGQSRAGFDAAYPPSVQRLIEEFTRLPGIGRRSAERLAFHVLKASKDDALKLAGAIGEVKRSIRHCPICFNFADEKVCAICGDASRDASTVLVVEQPRDLIALEQTGMYRGVFHVLMGRISPLDGVEPGDLTVGALLRRIDDPSANAQGATVREVVLGLNPNLEGDGTALYLGHELESRSVTVTRLARGLPSGGQLDLAPKAVLADAIEGRRRVE